MISPTHLAQRGLFAFDDAARETIEHCFAQLGDRAEASVMPELVALTAAEFALEPLIAEPTPILPVPQPIPVSARDAALAVVKANCNPIFCFPEAQGQPFTLPDVAAFGADVAKLAAVGISVIEPSTEIGDIARAVDRLELEHRGSDVTSAQRLGESGVLRLQGFLWAVKLSLPERPVPEAMDAAFEAFELTEPVSGALASMTR
jgi:hypothetical protein